MDKELEILKNLSRYLQLKIDNGEHKIIYNDLMWDEKTIDCINAIETLIRTVENSIDKSVVEKYLAEEQEKYNVYKKESKENENLKNGMWMHLGAKNMCEKILGIARNIVTLD